jgi:hypothetical protein
MCWFLFRMFILEFVIDVEGYKSIPASTESSKGSAEGDNVLYSNHCFVQRLLVSPSLFPSPVPFLYNTASTSYTACQYQPSDHTKGSTSWLPVKSAVGIKVIRNPSVCQLLVPALKFQMPPTRPVPNNHIEPDIKFKETIPLRTWWG